MVQLVLSQLCSMDTKVLGFNIDVVGKSKSVYERSNEELESKCNVCGGGCLNRGASRFHSIGYLICNLYPMEDGFFGWSVISIYCFLTTSKVFSLIYSHLQLLRPLFCFTNRGLLCFFVVQLWFQLINTQFKLRLVGTQEISKLRGHKYPLLIINSFTLLTCLFWLYLLVRSTIQWVFTLVV